MVAEEFIAAKHQTWRRLSDLIKRAQLNMAGLSAEELFELGQLYRQATSDLAVARRDYPGHKVVIYLNSLVGQGHATIYRSRANTPRTIWRYFSVVIPQTFRLTLPFTVISFLTFLIPALLAFLLTYRDPQAGIALMPGMEPVIENIRTKTEWWKDLNDDNMLGAGMIMTNNIRVSIIAFAGGMLIGLLTIYIIFSNGLMLGVIAGAAAALGFSGNLWGFVAAHGVIELSMIFISGGAGLQLAWAILQPGLLTRKAALLVAGRRTAVLMGLVIMLLVVAGIIEGFISPSALPSVVKYGVAIGSGVVLYSYLFLAGRAPDEDLSQPVDAQRIESLTPNISF